jgi:ethanolamine transporter EutH
VPRAIIDTDARNIIWYLRHMDLLGQVLILLAGAFAVVVLFKEPLKK